MLFGQSGGAGKIATLMAMPAAKGLFHRASLQSGAQYAAIPKARAQARTGKVLANLGLGPTQVDELHRVPADRLLQASVGTGIAFSPVVDGVTLPHMPFEPGAPDLAADVPVLIGTTETEGTYNAADLVEMDDAEMRARLGAPDVLGGNAGRIIEIFRRRRPHATPAELYLTIRAVPTLAIRQAENKAAQEAERPPTFGRSTGGRRCGRRIVHSPRRTARAKLDRLSCVDNVWHAPEMATASATGRPELANTLADKMRVGMGGACANRHSGLHGGIPRWPPYDARTASDDGDRQRVESRRRPPNRQSRSGSRSGRSPIRAPDVICRRGHVQNLPGSQPQHHHAMSP